MTTASPVPSAAIPSSRYRSVFAPGLFAGQRLWVTGGGSGIGRAVAHELAALGAHVVISGRSADKLERVAAEIPRTAAAAPGARSTSATTRPSRPTWPTSIATEGVVHGLVNNAGGQFPAPMMAISKRGFEAVVANNLTGGFLMMRELFLQSFQQHGGAIVNMTADFRNGMPGMAHSGAARAGMSNLTMTAVVRVGVVRRARERGGAGLDRLQRHGHLRRRDEGDDPQAQAPRAAAPPGPRRPR